MQLARRKPIRVADMTFSPLRGRDFEQDLDHVTPEGNLKFAEWALGSDLAFMLRPPENGRKLAEAAP
jgi:hypothetical protein